MKDEQLILEARERYEKIDKNNFENKERFKESMKFAFNIEEGHWDSSDVADRDKKGRPHLTVNKMAKFVRQVVNSERGIPDRDDIIPVDDKGDPAIAKVYNDLISDIEYQSEADQVYTLSGEHAVGGGFGYWRVITEYMDDCFDQEIRLKKIKNPLNVDIDPRGNFAFIREGVPWEEFKQSYPKAEKSDFKPAEDDELWFEDDKLFIAEYFRKEPYDKTIVEVIENNEVRVYEETDENRKGLSKLNVQRRDTRKSYKIMWYKITGHEVLERQEWPGKYIPIVEVAGHEVHLEGKTHKLSLIWDAKDMNQAYDYWFTSMTEKVALTPKAPYILTKDQINGYEDLWDTANTDNLPYLLYNYTSAGAPQRAQTPEIDQGAMIMLNLCDANIKDVLGMYESSLGMQSNERSGKAIVARSARSDLMTFNFPDNLRRAKVQTKKILLDLIPKIYDNQRVIRIRGEETVNINLPTVDAEGNEIILNDLSKGRYDVRVSIQNNPSRREQIAQNIIQAMQYAPDYAPVLLELLMQFLDAPGSDEILGAIRQKSAQMQQEQAMKEGKIPELGI
jgi:hypothetical protein